MKIFTSYFKDENINSIVDDVYNKLLIPKWLNHHKELTSELYIITNSDFLKKEFPCVDLKYTHMKRLNPMAHQISAWRTISNIIGEESCVYIDMDAYILDNKFLEYAKSQSDFKVTKKRIPYGKADVGISILKNSNNFLNYIKECESVMYDKSIRYHLEYVFDISGRKNFISWKECPILLGSSICGVSENIVCVHGTTSNEKLSGKIPVEIKNTLEEKRKIEHFYKNIFEFS